MTSFDFSNYLSPFTWRYGTIPMKKVFSEKHKYELWRKVWVTIAKVQHDAGLISTEELSDLEKNQDVIDIEEILNYELETKHDVVAGIKEFAQKAPIGGGKIHLGATSMDIVDNVEIIRIKEALQIIEKKLKELLSVLGDKIEKYASVPSLGYTHLQPAEPTTIGYRLAFYAQDLLIDYELLLSITQDFLKGKGIKGAVGTQASFSSLLQDTIKNDPIQMEKAILEKLGIAPLVISTQVYTRKIDYLVLTCLASISSSLSKFAGDVRVLQTPSIGEWSEPFDEKQVGSSAMPFKKNPILSEKICSLARYVSILPLTALENASLSYLERTLDDSANKRVIIPEAFLATDEIINSAIYLMKGLQINLHNIERNLATYAPFVASESIIIESVKNGANRQQIHEILRQISILAWEDIRNGKANSMELRIKNDPTINNYLSRDVISNSFTITSHIGTAPTRSREIVKQIRKLMS